MSDARLNDRGVEADYVQVVAIQARSGFVSVCTRRLPEPLGREAWLHALRLLIEAGLKVWPEAAAVVTAVALTAAVDRAHAGDVQASECRS